MQQSPQPHPYSYPERYEISEISLSVTSRDTTRAPRQSHKHLSLCTDSPEPQRSSCMPHARYARSRDAGHIFARGGGRAAPDRLRCALAGADRTIVSLYTVTSVYLCMCGDVCIDLCAGDRVVFQTLTAPPWSASRLTQVCAHAMLYPVYVCVCVCVCVTFVFDEARGELSFEAFRSSAIDVFGAIRCMP